MDLGLYILLLLGSLFIVVKSSDYFLQAVEQVGRYFGLSAFLVGVILVGFGTSLPELATSISSVISGRDDVAIANIIGSNMANILLIIGVSSLFLGSINFKKRLINLDLPFLLGITVLFAILIFDGNLNWSDGLFLLVGFVSYLIYSLSQQQSSTDDKSLVVIIRSLVKPKTDRPATSPTDKLSTPLLIAVAAMIGLIAASRLAVFSMLEIADMINIAVGVITFFTLALGTSLPELVVSFKALRQNKGDLVAGNIIGSSVFNILLVGGVVSLIAPQFLDPTILVWSIIGLLVATISLVISGITQKIHVCEGLVFILLYTALIIKIAS